MTSGSVLSRTLTFLFHSGNITEERAGKKSKNKREKISGTLSPGHDSAVSVMISQQLQSMSCVWAQPGLSSASRGLERDLEGPISLSYTYGAVIMPNPVKEERVYLVSQLQEVCVCVYIKNVSPLSHHIHHWKQKK